jgi:choline dehydrogenase-like flavoprotein
LIQNATVNELPSTFPYQIDMNAGNPIGVGYVQESVGDGQRSSSATSYLAPPFLKRSNLAVLVNAEATKLIKARLLLLFTSQSAEIAFDDRQVL